MTARSARRRALTWFMLGCLIAYVMPFHVVPSWVILILAVVCLTLSVLHAYQVDRAHARGDRS